MKMRGGYLPKIAGKPADSVRDIPIPEQISIGLRQGELLYRPAVATGEKVEFGQPLALADAVGGSITLPAPASGTVHLETDGTGDAVSISLSVETHTPLPTGRRFSDSRASLNDLRQALAQGGVWPLIWSSATRQMPSLASDAPPPKRIIVNSVMTEPFRAQGVVVLQRQKDSFAAGLAFLQNLLPDKEAIHFTLDKASESLYQQFLASSSDKSHRIRIERVPFRYPIEDPRILTASLKRGNRDIADSDEIWVLDVQAVAAVGACLRDGLALHERILAVGGPGAETPQHVHARIGTPMSALLAPADNRPDRLPLEGGLLRGEPITAKSAVLPTSDALFLLPRSGEREFLAFMNPGFTRTSILPCFASRFTGAADRHISTSLRGERRPCIACGLCESICPSGLMPQIIHRFLYNDAIDDAEAMGINLCIDCSLCTYVCPSKIDLSHQFQVARENLRLEHEAVAAAEEARKRNEEIQKREREARQDATA